VVKDGGLALRYFGEDYRLQWVGGTIFALPDQGQFRFRGNRLEEMIDGQARLQFAKQPPIAPQALAGFVGTYRSTDVDGPVTIAVKGAGRLAITYPAGEATLRPIARDHFASPEEDFNSVRFQRGRSGRVTGLTLTVSSGVTRLRFRRVAG
jgi:hypothetical protein